MYNVGATKGGQTFTVVRITDDFMEVANRRWVTGFTTGASYWWDWTYAKTISFPPEPTAVAAWPLYN